MKDRIIEGVIYLIKLVFCSFGIVIGIILAGAGIDMISYYSDTTNVPFIAFVLLWLGVFMILGMLGGFFTKD